jgi:hypothetical protein
MTILVRGALAAQITRIEDDNEVSIANVIVSFIISLFLCFLTFSSDVRWRRKSHALKTTTN